MSKNFENDLCRIYWYDSEQTILMVDVYKRWTWDDAFGIVNQGNDMLKQVNHEKYTICHLIGDAGRLPTNNYTAIANIQKLIQLDPSEEELVFYVGQFNFLKRLITVSGKISALIGKTRKYHYVRDVAEAFAAIHEHKAKKQTILN